MARAIFLKPFNYTSRKRNVGWSVQASPEPQSFPQELIDAAFAKTGVAIPVPTGKARAKAAKNGGGDLAALAQTDSSLGQALNDPAISAGGTTEELK